MCCGDRLNPESVAVLHPEFSPMSAIRGEADSQLGRTTTSTQTGRSGSRHCLSERSLTANSSRSTLAKLAIQAGSNESDARFQQAALLKPELALGAGHLRLGRAVYHAGVRHCRTWRAEAVRRPNHLPSAGAQHGNGSEVSPGH